MGLLAVILADGAPLDVIGPYGALVGAVAVIGWGVKDRARMQARHDATVARIIAERDKAAERGDGAMDRLVENGERLIPLVEGVKPVLEANTRALDYAREAMRR